MSQGQEVDSREYGVRSTVIVTLLQGSTQGATCEQIRRAEAFKRVQKRTYVALIEYGGLIQRPVGLTALFEAFCNTTVQLAIRISKYHNFAGW